MPSMTLPELSEPDADCSTLQAITAQVAPRLLVVEDDVEMRRLLAWSLGRQGYQVQQCQDGFQALDRLGSPPFGDQPMPFALVISDIRMPGAGGLELLRRLRQAQRNTPVILVTAFGDQATHRRAKALGAAWVFDKPFEIADLLARVREVLKQELADADKLQFASPGQVVDLDEVIRGSKELTASVQIRRKRRLEDGPADSNSTVCVEMDMTADFEAIDGVVGFVKDLVLGMGASTDEEFDIGLALHEALVNAVEHGSRAGPDRTVQVRVCCLDPPGVLMTVRNPGKGFDPVSLPDPCEQSNLVRPRGRGIFLIRRLMDEVRFACGGREIRLKKRLSTARAPSPGRDREKRNSG